MSLISAGFPTYIAALTVHKTKGLFYVGRGYNSKIKSIEKKLLIPILKSDIFEQLCVI